MHISLYSSRLHQEAAKHTELDFYRATLYHLVHVPDPSTHPPHAHGDHPAAAAVAVAAAATAHVLVSMTPAYPLAQRPCACAATPARELSAAAHAFLKQWYVYRGLGQGA
ncbi:predicted protein [Plenodomus lingam JN3]|uniref:Uncharacterized protein n=1 Tax=Leptosphaeria maculans (strain JN3 / isolate v23.1.3 / race Av1-4-5-6-7-8) TaxID=985895 RepID=E5A6A9_LEPMJ|nr:predicted protein [Plenodomus lingam JN3]CBX99154.1 predicted protein [Plenodomus lingam JN3]